MQKCIACDNSFRNTKHTRPELIYHKLPTNADLKKKWLEVLRINISYSSQFVCSDHFLKDNYKPNLKRRLLYKNTIPQPWRNQNGFPHNNTIQINNIENGSRTNHQNIFKLEPIENDAGAMRTIRLFEWSGVQAVDVKPVFAATKDKGDGRCCSVKKCFNRHSKGLSFFSYPRDLTRRNIWIEKCRLVADPNNNKIMNRYKVCGVHFEEDCFKNPIKRNRLCPDAIPTLFLYNDMMDNTSSTSSAINSGYVHVNYGMNIPSTSSNFINYLQQVNNECINEIRLSCTELEYSENTSSLDFKNKCSLPECITNTGVNKVDITLFKPPEECINEWSSALGLQLTINSNVCELHFRPEDIKCQATLINGLNEEIKLLTYSALPIPINGLPSVCNARNNLPESTNKCSKSSNTSISIDDLPTTDPNLKLKLMNIIANSSVSITLAPIKNP